MKTIKHYPLSLLLSESDEMVGSFLRFHSLFREFGSDAEIFSDALHALISQGDFGCYEVGVKAILFAIILDSEGHNYLHDEFDTLRNGKALSFLLQDVVFPDDPVAPSDQEVQHEG